MEENGRSIISGEQDGFIPVSYTHLAAEKLVKIVDTVEPETGLVEKYEKRYQVFKQIYPAMKGLFQLGTVSYTHLLVFQQLEESQMERMH